jgi:hypothetical protein
MDVHAILRHSGANSLNWRCSKSRGKRHVSSARRVTPLEKGEPGRPNRFVRPVWAVTIGLPVFTDGLE